MFFFRKKKKAKEEEVLTPVSEAVSGTVPAPEADPSENVYTLLNSDSALLARGLLESPPDAANMQMRITDGSPAAVARADIVQCIPLAASGSAIIGRVLLRRGEVVVLDPIRKAGVEVRQNFRMPMDFRSFAYPPEGGRVSIQAQNLSCGGIAFLAEDSLTIESICELVIPCTTPEPLILHGEILRELPGEEGKNAYAAKFLQLLEEEEQMLRESVFNAQLLSIVLARNKQQTQPQSRGRGFRR